MWKMNAYAKRLWNVTRGIFLLKTQKESIFWEFFLDFIFQGYFKCQPI
jgi:hypothetical protein